jgi:hypothetical protein
MQINGKINTAQQVIMYYIGITEYSELFARAVENHPLSYESEYELFFRLFYFFLGQKFHGLPGISNA